MYQDSIKNQEEIYLQTNCQFNTDQSCRLHSKHLPTPQQTRPNNGLTTLYTKFKIDYILKHLSGQPKDNVLFSNILQTTGGQLPPPPITCVAAEMKQSRGRGHHCSVQWEDSRALCVHCSSYCWPIVERGRRIK